MARTVVRRSAQLPTSRVGQKYALDRWLELAADRPEWWARGDGIGLRLRLQELLNVADSLANGGLHKETIAWLFEDASEVLTRPGGFASKWCKALSSQIKEKFGGNADRYRPRTQANALIEAALHQLSAPQYRIDLLGSLERTARGAGWSVSGLNNIDELIELIDAELVFEGHSASWRRKAAEDASEIWSGSAISLPDAISEALRQNREDRKPEPFQAIVPVDELRSPSLGSAGVTVFERPGMEAEIGSWGVGNEASLLTHPEMAAASHFYKYEVLAGTASDPYAAAVQVDRRFRQDADLIRLRDGELNDPSIAIIYDPSSPPAAAAYALPPRRIHVAPDELATSDGGTIPKFKEALAQVAQAGRASAATALVDLWTAVEVLFGGLDPDVEAGLTMARLAPFPYATHVTMWLGQELGTTGYGHPPSGQEMEWLHTKVLADRKKVLAVLRTQANPVLWKRLTEVFDWGPGSGFQSQATALRERLERTARRAYIYRNMAVHEAEAPARALGVTLPLFADLVRIALGHTIQFATGSGALPEAVFAAIEVEEIGNRWADQTIDRASGLSRLLYRT